METLTRADVIDPSALSEIDYQEVVATFDIAEERRELLDGLDGSIRDAVVVMGRSYVQEGQYTQLKKLFKNAVLYVAEGRVERVSDGFLINGITNNHHTTVDNDGHWGCDCDLFNGRGKFEGRAGECSHIQSATLFMLSEQE